MYEDSFTERFALKCHAHVLVYKYTWLTCSTAVLNDHYCLSYQWMTDWCMWPFRPLRFRWQWAEGCSWLYWIPLVIVTVSCTSTAPILKSHWQPIHQSAIRTDRWAWARPHPHHRWVTAGASRTPLFRGAPGCSCGQCDMGFIARQGIITRKNTKNFYIFFKIIGLFYVL